MRRHTASDQQRYGKGAIILHWLLAALLALEIGLGFAMPKDSTGFALYQLHKSVGMLILGLTLVRIGWRLTHSQPPAAERGLTGALAKAVHIGFYAFMLHAPLSGWALVSTAPVQVPTVLFGIAELPHLPLPAGIHEPAEAAHAALAWFGLALFALHVAGALRHHFIIHDGLMQRMAPRGSALVGGALGVAVIVLGTGTLLFAGRLPPETQLAASGQGSPAPAAQEAEAAGQPLVQMSEEELPASNGGMPSEEPLPAADAAADTEPLPPPVWTIQPGGRLAFSLDGGSSGQISGSFGRWDGRIRFDPERPENAEIAMEIDLSSASVGDQTMDGMLKGDEFFAVNAGPVARYRTASIRALGSGRYRAEGTLSLKGLAKAQLVDFVLTGSGLRQRVEGSATIDRTAFAIGTGSSAAELGRTVAVTFSFEARGRRTAEE